MDWINGKKTYITGLITLLCAWAAYLLGSSVQGQAPLSLYETVSLTVISLMGMFVRHGIATEAAKTTGAAKSPAPVSAPTLPLLVLALLVPIGIAALGCGGALGLVGALVGCAGTQARTRVLAPALLLAWPAINDEATAGLAMLPDDQRPAESARAGAFAAAMSSRNAGTIAAARGTFPSVRAAAMLWIGRREASGEVSSGVAESLRERISRFEEDLGKLTPG